MQTQHYRVPPMPWGIDRNEAVSTFHIWLGNSVQVTDLGYPKYPYGLQKWIFIFWMNTPFLRRKMPSIIRISKTNRI